MEHLDQRLSRRLDVTWCEHLVNPETTEVVATDMCFCHLMGRDGTTDMCCCNL